MKSNETRILKHLVPKLFEFQVIIRVGNCTNFSFDDDNGHIHSLFQQLFTIDNHPNKTQCIIRKEKLPC